LTATWPTGSGTPPASPSDPDLLAEVVERRVVLECCPRSNYWTRTEAELPTLADHPVGRLLGAGARVCLNTDDRSLFGNDLSSEYRVVAEARAWTTGRWRP
jgi:adenosine deaminase